MSVTSILTAIAGLATIVGGIVYLVKTGFILFKKPLDQKKQEVDQSLAEERKRAEQTGRPQ